MKPMILLQGFFQLGDLPGAPCPKDQNNPGADWWWDHLAKQAKELSDIGFTAVWLPPATKGAKGLASVGYDVFDDYDLGSKFQAGAEAKPEDIAMETRYGSREQLERCVAIMRANGLDVYVDIVDEQRLGGDGPEKSTYRYVDADGNPNGGRFPKDPQNFHGYSNMPPNARFQSPFVPQDPNVYDGANETFDGSDLAPINGVPARYVFDNLIAAADWQIRALGVQGYRLDNGRGQSTDFLVPFLQSGAMAGKFAVAEFWNGDLSELKKWLYDPHSMGGQCSAFDFPLRFPLRDMCDPAKNFDMSTLDHAGLAGGDPFHAVTFVENHDTDHLDPIVSNKLLAYAYILTSEGYPSVFYKDYSTDPNCYGGGMKDKLKDLIWIHQNIASGSTQPRWNARNDDVFAFERLGDEQLGEHLLVGLNKNVTTPRTIQVETGFGPDVELQDYAKHGSKVTTDERGQVVITIPANNGGLGYVCYAREGIQPTFENAPSSVTQEFEGAQDLDIKPAQNAEEQACKVYAAADTIVSAHLAQYDTDGWTARTRIKVVMYDPDQAQCAEKKYAASTAKRKPIECKATKTGWYTFTVQAIDLPASKTASAYRLAVTYTAPLTIQNDGAAITG